MANYLLLYSGGSMPETPAEQEAVIQAWTAWFGKLGDAVKDGGNPFTGGATSISGNAVSDGGVDAMASGYSVIKADSLDAAVEIAKGCPVLEGGARISVYETFEVM
jgi:hypothetical protein